MGKIKIISNPYENSITYYSMNEESQGWKNISEKNCNSKLREEDSKKCFFPFKMKEIVDTIVEDYYVQGKEKIQVEFEGTFDEFAELEKVCTHSNIKDKVELVQSDKVLNNARYILGDIKDTFESVKPIIENVVRRDEVVMKKLGKVSDALKDIIPICVFGNYSAGKSTFINALIGKEILPSGGDPVTAKIYEIKKSLQPDFAKIKFVYEENDVEYIFEGQKYRLERGEGSKELLKNISESIENCDVQDLFVQVNVALECVNEFEKKNGKKSMIGNVIRIEIPFSDTGVLGSSQNKFVIFDTPGSNSETYAEHSAVLAEAMDGFSNGIPVWVTQYETVDSKDNASLCEQVLEIEALDKRFTMIIFNKADDSDLEEDGFTEEEIEEIKEYSAVEKMYASGIYFVSSIMGLGAKNDGNLRDNHYRKTYRKQKEMYLDKEDEDYSTLYKYNIMPEQIKEQIMVDSVKHDKLIYVNSGLYCIEQEMESFASKYAAYNKCQMVYTFLSQVIEDTKQQIDQQKYREEQNKADMELKLEKDKKELIDKLSIQLDEYQEKSGEVSAQHIEEIIEEKLDYSQDLDELSNIDDEIRNRNSEERELNRQKQDYEDAQSNMWKHLRENGKRLTEGNVFSSIKDLRESLVDDYNKIQNYKDIKEKAETQIDVETSDELIQIVNDNYKKNIEEAHEIIKDELKGFWQDQAYKIREAMIETITGTKALNSSQKDEVANMIVNYGDFEIGDERQNVFIKKSFLKGHFFGVKLIDSERLNLKRLNGRYNRIMEEVVKEMTVKMNKNYYEGFKIWAHGLYDVIAINIIEYNPELRNIAERIQDCSEKIENLEQQKQTLSGSFSQIEEWMKWKDNE